MDDTYQELKSFKFQANLMYVAGVLRDEEIDYKSEGDKLFVRSEDHAKALAIVDKLDLDESPVSDESDGYISDYQEWTDKQYVSGYFTGGKIPYWMNSIVFAKYFGPYLLLIGVFLLWRWDFSVGDIIPMLFMSVYFICGLLLTYRAYKKPSSSNQRNHKNQ